MSAAASSPEVLIADADPWTADLLEQLVLDVRCDAQVIRVGDGQAAMARCKRRLPELVIADSELPGVDGLELLRQLRRHPRTPALPFILISSRLDASSVRAAKPLAPTAYLAKPFNAEALRQRLASLLISDGEELLCPIRPLLVNRLEDYLDAMREEGQGAPLLASVRDSVSQYLSSQEPNLRELEQSFARDPQITAYLIAAANSAAHHNGSACQTLAQALPRLGVARTLNLVLGLSIRRNARLSDPRLAEQGTRAWATAQRSAEVAHWLARELSLDAELCYTAGLLHNIGELALLRCMQDWQDADGSLSDEEISQALKQRAAGFGSALRIRWRLPFGLRELVAAYYALNSGVFSREALVLNLTGQIVALEDRQPLSELRDARSVRLLRIDPGLLERVPQQASAA